MTPTAYTVLRLDYDATRPWAVIAPRSFNRVVERYPTQSQAKRRARDMNRRHLRVNWVCLHPEPLT